MLRPTHHTYYKGVDAIINPMNRYNTNVRQMKENFPTWSPEELDIIANGKKAVENDLSRLIPTDIVAKTAHVKVSHNDRTETMAHYTNTHTPVSQCSNIQERDLAQELPTMASVIVEQVCTIILHMIFLCLDNPCLSNMDIYPVHNDISGWRNRIEWN